MVPRRLQDRADFQGLPHRLPREQQQGLCLRCWKRGSTERMARVSDFDRTESCGEFERRARVRIQATGDCSQV
jgi:hypothetical protein